MTKAAVGVAVDRAAATVLEERGLPPQRRRARSYAKQEKRREAPGHKRKAFASLLGSLVTFLGAEDAVGFAGRGKVVTYSENMKTLKKCPFISAVLPCYNIMVGAAAVPPHNARVCRIRVVWRYKCE